MISLTTMRNTANSVPGAPSKLCLGGGLMIVSKMIVWNRWQLKTPAQAELGRGTREYR
jgi:hypothetical protein